MSEDKVSKEVQQKVGQLQMIEQNVQSLMMQKQMQQAQLMEVESALDEMKDATQTYKIVGNVMISQKKADLQKEMKEKQELLKKRLSSLETQEKNIREKAEALQEEILKEIK
ncbi:prefoldin subunit beta [Nanoarchaeota archaeon]